MTKPLSLEEKKRRQEERDAIKSAEKAGKTASQAMEDLRAEKVNSARQEIEKQDAEKMDFYAREDAERRKQAEAFRDKPSPITPVTVSPASGNLPSEPEVKAEKATRVSEKGLTRCDGSGLVVGIFTDQGFEPNPHPTINSVGRDINDEPWDFHRKRAVCPECSLRVGISPYGSRKSELPVGYRLDTHYRKQQDPRPSEEVSFKERG